MSAIPRIDCTCHVSKASVDGESGDRHRTNGENQLVGLEVDLAAALHERRHGHAPAVAAARHDRHRGAQHHEHRNEVTRLLACSVVEGM
jgi:hypothetical protein